MRFLIKFILVLIFIYYGIKIAFYSYENYPCSLDNVVISKCSRVDETSEKKLFGTFMIPIKNFCTNYNQDSEERFLKRLDSLIIEKSKNINRKKYHIVGFSLLNNCFQGCDSWSQNGSSTFNNPSLNELDCNEAEVLYCSIDFTKNGFYTIIGYKLRNRHVNKLNDLNIFTRKLDF